MKALLRLYYCRAICRTECTSAVPTPILSPASASSMLNLMPPTRGVHTAPASGPPPPLTTNECLSRTESSEFAPAAAAAAAAAAAFAVEAASDLADDSANSFAACFLVL